MIKELFPIIIAGLMNGSFVMPSKYIKSLSSDKIWFWHSIIGFIIIPFMLLAITEVGAIKLYLSLPHTMIATIFLSGLIFGLGQICFIKAIQKIGVSASFSVNLGIGTTIGSIFVTIYKGVFFTVSGFFVSLSVILTLASLLLYYLGCTPERNNPAGRQDKENKIKHYWWWVIAIFAGICSGLQNVIFTIIFLASLKQENLYNPFWIWPLFLLGAAIPMAFTFYIRNRRQKIYLTLKEGIPLFVSIKDFLLISCMGVCFAGSLAIYSTMIWLSDNRLHLFAWPTFMISIVLAAYFWGNIEAKVSFPHRNKIYTKLSALILVLSIILLAIYLR